MTEPDSLRSLIGRMCAGLTASDARGQAISPGDRAALRRLNVDRSPGFAFWKMLARYDVDPVSREQERSWMAVLRAVGHMAELHDPGTRLGSGLADAALSELRLSRLLEARGDALLDEVRAVGQLLAAKGVRVDLSELAALLLTQDPDRGERLRRSIARSYFVALHHLNSQG